MSGNSAPAAPDYGPLINAQTTQAAISNDIAQQQLKWAQDVWTSNKDTNDKVVNQLLQAQSTAQANAQKDRALYEDTFVPVIKQQAALADEWGTPEKKDQQIGQAQALVGQNFDAARNASTRQLESFGLDPSSTRYQALDLGTRVAEAAAKAGAGNTAAVNTDNTRNALIQQAVNTGLGIQSQVNPSLNTAAGAGTGAVSANNATTSTGGSTMGTGTQWSGLGANYLSGAGTSMTNDYNNQLNQYKANQTSSSGIGSLLGGAIGLIGGPVGSAFGKGFGSAIGSAITGFADGGAVEVPAAASPTQGKAVDDVPARLTVGEFVIPKDVVDWKGQEFFQKLVAQSMKARGGAQPAEGRPMPGAQPQAPTFASRPQAVAA